MTKSFVLTHRGAPNDLEYSRGGVTEYGKCLETGKQQNPLWSKTVTDRGHRTTF